MKMNELRAAAKEAGIDNRRAESKASLLARLALARQTIDQRPSNALPKDAPKPEVVKHYTTPEQLYAALEPFKGKNLQIKIDEDTETWHFKYGIAEDSGTLHQPLSVIKRMAEMLLRARMPAKIKDVNGGVVFG
jgi:hypothetical protein